MESFIGWVGGKKQLRKEIIKRFPKNYKKYVEVCGGAGWVLFAKEYTTKELEVFNDIDSQLINLYRCIQRHPEALIKELQDILSARELFYDFKEQINCRGLTDIQRAARYFYLIKCSFGCKKENFATRTKVITNTLERFVGIQERLKRVVIENRDFEELIKLYDSPETLFYIDPPYFKTERYYKNEKIFLEEDHYRLNNIVSTSKGKFIISYNDCEFIRYLYQNYNIESISRTTGLSAKTNSKIFEEVIITNY